MTDLRISEIRYASATSAEVATGLLGFVTFTLNEALSLDGLALRRTLTGALALSFPARTDRAGRRHAYIRPITDEARLAIETQVFAGLGLQGERAA